MRCLTFDKFMQIEPHLVAGIIFSDLVIREAGSNKISLIGCFQRFQFPQFPFSTGQWFATEGVIGIRDTTSFIVKARNEFADSKHVVSSTSAFVEVKDFD